MIKKKIGIFSFACCEGCQLQILDLGQKLLKLLRVADITYFKLAQEKNLFNKFDIAIVEGAISNKKELEELKKIRSASKYLVAIGACAVSGGIPSLIIEKTQKKTLGVDKFVNVDYHIRGCPIDKDEFENIIIGLLVDRKEPKINHPVCVECNEKEIECLFKKGLPCLGPVSAAGCKAICPERSTPCEACRGLIKDANIASVINEFRKMGLTEKEILDKLYKFNPVDRKEAEKCT
jgi:coenzyme F420-reducing hydrogenase gamma subunit